MVNSTPLMDKMRGAVAPALSGSFDLSNLKLLDRGKWTERGLRFLCFGGLALLLLIVDGLRLPLVWVGCYFGLLALNSAVIARLPDQVGLAGSVGIAGLLLTDSLLFGAMVLYVWALPEPIYPFLALFMLAGYMINAATEHSEEPVWAAVDIVAVSLTLLGLVVLLRGRVPEGYWTVFALSAALLALYFALSLLNVAEARRALSAVKARLSEAARGRAMGRLTTGISGEINDLMTGVLGNLELARTAETPEERDLQIRMAQMAAHKAARIAGHLLAYSGNLPLKPEVVSAAALLDGLAPRLRRLLPVGMTLDMAPVTDDLRLLIDPVHLEAALTELVRNAVAASAQRGAVLLSASTSHWPGPDLPVGGVTLRPGRYVLLEVHDRAGTLTRATAEREQEPFHKGPAASAGHGWGLGLSSAKGFAEQCGGALVVDCVPERRTSVGLLLPRYPGR
jgi:signal transduction histidine kinase